LLYTCFAPRSAPPRVLHSFPTRRSSDLARILLLNDDARPLPNLLLECDRLLRADPAIGCVGCRAIERGYVESGEGIGRLSNRGRSEEHTSELQSRGHLVCRLLLEKKKEI